MHIVPDQVETKLVYSTMIRAITPRPIAWVSTVSPGGHSNVAPFSYFNGIGSEPAALMFSAVNHPDGRTKDTVRNIEATGQFVVNVVPYSLAEAMQLTSASLDYETSEFSAAGLSEKPSQRVEAPGVAESPIQFECETLEIVRVGEGPLAANVVIGKILLIDIADDVIDSNGKIDPAKLDTIGRMGGKAYCRTKDRFEIGRGRPE